jgi:hypothetical protein
MPMNALNRPFTVRFPGKFRSARVAEIGMLQTQESRVADMEMYRESAVMVNTSRSPESIRLMARVMPSVIGSSRLSSSP